MKIFAIYFPQFYAIKENSKAWGEGFTDWDRVRSSRSQYKGHVIPRQPLNENYYAQDNEETIKWQVELATSYGIDGFDFYHYWFDGKLLLGEPVKIFAGLNVDLEYCLTWANETWTKQWSGSSETIIEQLHLNDEHLWLEHLNYLCSHFIKANYLSVEGRPVFRIYRADLIKNFDELKRYYDNYVRMHLGFDGIYWIYTNGYKISNSLSVVSHFDKVLHFQPRLYFDHIANLRKGALLSKLLAVLRNVPEKYQKYMNFMYFIFSGSSKYSYFDYMEYQKEFLLQNKQDFHCLSVDWDNTPRYGSRFKGFYDFNLDYFRDLLTFAKDNVESDFIFLNAWNEWAESAYLEPDLKYKWGKLELVKDVFGKNNSNIKL